MTNYIKFEPLREDILNDVEYDGDTVNHFLGIVDSQPFEDVVEVVRCKECQKWDTSQKFLTSCACSRWSQSMPYPRLTNPDDFCSFGERKEGDEK